MALQLQLSAGPWDERLLLLLEAAAKADPEGVAARLTSKRPPTVYLVNRGNLLLVHFGLARIAPGWLSC